MKTIRFITFLFFVAFLPACDKNADENDTSNENVVIDYSKIKSRVTFDAITGDETREFYSFDAEGKQTGYKKYVNNNRVREYTNYRYGDRSLTYDWYGSTYSYEVAYVFYNDDYDTLKYVSKTITDAMTGEVKSSTAYEYDAMGRPIWYEYLSGSYKKRYPAFISYFSGTYYFSYFYKWNLENFNLYYEGLTLTIEPPSNKYEVDSREWSDCVDSMLVVGGFWEHRNFFKRKPKTVIRFYDETFTKIVSVEDNAFSDYNIQNKFDSKGNPIRYTYIRKPEGYFWIRPFYSFYCTYDVDGRPIRCEYRTEHRLTRRRNYAYNEKELRYDEEIYRLDNGEQISESKVHVEFW